MFKILDKRNSEVTAEQQAVFNKISTNNADGYVDGFLNSLRIAKMSSNVISIDSGLLSIQGFRSVNDTLTTYTVSVTPSEPIPFQLVATYSHYISDENDTLEITTRPTQKLRREPLFAGQNAVYEVELAEFNMTADGIADFTVTLEKIVYNEQDLSELLDKVTQAEQDSATALEKVNELETQVIEKQGTAVYVGGEAQSRVNFTSDPQTQITEAQSDISDIVSGAQTVGKATQDADGNVIDTTYSKLSQVVRTDTVSSNTDEQKRIASENILRYITASPTIEGWYRVAKLSNQGIYEISVSSSYNINAPMAIKFIVAVSTSLGYNTSITQIGGAPNLTVVTQARLNEDSGNLYFEIYVANPNNSIGVSYKAVTSLGSGLSVSHITPVAFTNITIPFNVIAAIKVVCGMSTTGGVYQNGSPVLVGSAPTWVEGTSGSLTLPSSGWYYLQASNNSNFVNNFGNSGIVYVDIIKIRVYFPLPQNLHPDSSYSIESNQGTLYARTGSDNSTWYIRYYKLA